MLRRKFVPGPVVTPEQATLLDYIQWVDDSDPHWKNGITYPEICGGASSTYDLCVSAPIVTGSNPTKSDNSGRNWRGALPFSVYTEIDCSPVGWWDESEPTVQEALRRSEHTVVEAVIATGNAAGQPVVFPHFSANTQVLDPSDSLIVLQPAAVSITGTYDVVEALGLLEQSIANCLGAQGMIHVTLPVFDALVNQLVVFQKNGLWYTAKGNMVVPGSGYTGNSPAGAAPAAGTSWMYATGPMIGYRGRPQQVGTRTESLDRSVNTLKVIVERTYVIGWVCCLTAILVSTGGVVTGTATSAT
jgi:hypothetical protein